MMTTLPAILSQRAVVAVMILLVLPVVVLMALVMFVAICVETSRSDF